MYERYIRPLLFRFSPETIHRVAVWLLKASRWIPGSGALVRAFCTLRSPLLEKEVFGIRFPNPIGLAAGFDKNAEAYGALSNLGFGFVEVGTVTPRPQPGNPRPRLFRLPADKALINRMGFNNGGVEKALSNLHGRDGKQIVGVNIGKNTLTPNENAAADYLKVFRKLYDYADYFVINVSCPNIAKLTGLQDKDNLTEIVAGLTDFRRGQNLYRPILIKISPDLTTQQMDDMIEVMIKCGLDGMVATNTSTSREELKTGARVLEAIGNGGLSGAPLTKRSLDTVRYIYEKTGGNYPIIGVGGVMTPDDAIAMLAAGASLVQVYTGFIYGGPAFVKNICRKIRNFSLTS